MKTLPHEWQEPEISHREILSIWGSDSELLSISHDLLSSSSASRSFSGTEAPTGTESHVSETATSPMRDLPSMDFSLELRWEFLLASDQAFSSDSVAVVIDFYIKTNLTIFFTLVSSQSRTSTGTQRCQWMERSTITLWVKPHIFWHFWFGNDLVLFMSYKGNI